LIYTSNISCMQKLGRMQHQGNDPPPEAGSDELREGISTPWVKPKIISYIHNEMAEAGTVRIKFVPIPL
jgi:hypothetical protein